MTRKADIAVELWQAYRNGRITAESALLQVVIRNLKPSEQRVYAMICIEPGLTSNDVMRRIETFDQKTAAVTLKGLLDMGIVARRTCWSEDGRNTRFYRYYAVKE